MSKTKNVNVSYSSPFAGIWFVAFILIKLAGTGLAAWSWWWILLPIVPVLALFLQKMGML